MKKCISLLSAVLAVAVLASGVQANSTELLDNGGFESALAAPDLNPTDNFSGFSGFGTFPTLETTNPNSGSSHLALTTAGVDNNFQGVQQVELGVNEGDEFTLSLFAAAAGPLQTNAEFRIEWLNSSGGFVGGQFDNNQDITASLTTNYQQFSQTVTAPFEATQLRAVIAVQSFAAGDGSGTVYFDDISLTGPKAIPEPTAAGLVALAFAGIVARRRR